MSFCNKHIAKDSRTEINYTLCDVFRLKRL